MERLGKHFSSVAFSLGALYLIAYAHAFGFFSSLGASWYLPTLSTIGLFTVSKQTIAVFLILISWVGYIANLKRNSKTITIFKYFTALAFLGAMILSPVIDQFGLSFFKHIPVISYVLLPIIFGAFVVAGIFDNSPESIKKSNSILIIPPMYLFCALTFPFGMGSIEGEVISKDEGKRLPFVLIKEDTTKYQLLYMGSESSLLIDRNSDHLAVVKYEDIRYLIRRDMQKKVGFQN